MSQSIEVSKSESYRRGVMMLVTAFLSGVAIGALIFSNLMPRSFESEIAACASMLRRSVANTDICINVLNQCMDTLNQDSAPKGRDL